MPAPLRLAISIHRAGTGHVTSASSRPDAWPVTLDATDPDGSLEPTAQADSGTVNRPRRSGRHYCRGVRSFLVTDEVRDYAVGHGSWRVGAENVIHGS